MGKRRRRAARQEVILAPRAVVPRVNIGAMGGGLEGADRTSRETALWYANRGSPDQLINYAKEEADARGREMVTNDGYSQGYVDTYRDGIVGDQYTLNAQPNWEVLSRLYDTSFDETWATEFQQYAEQSFNLIADSEDCWLDASRRNTFTGQIRLGLATWAMTGEDLATAEWIRETGRPFHTSIQSISPSRLSNPDQGSDERFLRRGVRMDSRGKPLGYYIRVGHPYDPFDMAEFRWTYVPAVKPWGRPMVLHTIDPIQVGQTRAVSDMVAVLSGMKMTKQFSKIVLQNAVVNASYAAAIESDLPTEAIASMLGGGAGMDAPGAAFLGFMGNYLEKLREYMSEANAVAFDGVKIPHLFPGTKLNTKTLGTPGGIGTDFETSLLRYIASGLGISYEEFANDWSKTNYSSGVAASNKTRRHMRAKKKFIADRRANWTYGLWLEEDLAAGNVPLPSGWGPEIYYQPYGKEALCSCGWIGSGRGQIDELKETQAAMLRIKAGLSTVEIECARLGLDWRKLYRQLKREQDMRDELEIMQVLDAQENAKGVDTQGTLTGNTNSVSREDLVAAFREAMSAIKIEVPKIDIPAPAAFQPRRELTRVLEHDQQGRILRYERTYE